MADARYALSLVSFIFCPLAETSRDPEDYDLYTISAPTSTTSKASIAPQPLSSSRSGNGRKLCSRTNDSRIRKSIDGRTIPGSSAGSIEGSRSGADIQREDFRGNHREGLGKDLAALETGG